MDTTLRTLERTAARTEDRETQLRLAAAQLRRGELVAITEVVCAPPRRTAAASCARSRSQPRIYLLREPDSGDLTARVRQEVLGMVLRRLGRPAVQARWTYTAGCPCGCSPAFILRGRGAEGLGDTYVRVLISARETKTPAPAAPREPWRPTLAPTPPATLAPGHPFLAPADRTLPPTRLAPPAPAPTATNPVPLATAATGGRLPPPGTVLQRRDRRGQVRCEATVTAAGVWFQGTRFTSLSAAALAAARSLGLTPRSLNGWAWWGLQNPRARRRQRPASAPTEPAPEPTCVCCGGRHGLLRCPDMGR